MDHHNKAAKNTGIQKRQIRFGYFRKPPHNKRSSLFLAKPCHQKN